MGSSSLAWATVAPVVAVRTTTVVYDRGGLGRSPASDGPRDLDHLADDLEDLLGQLRPGLPRPVSWSGTAGADRSSAPSRPRRPDDVAGLVLVDQTDEGCELHLESEGGRRDRILATGVPAGHPPRPDAAGAAPSGSVDAAARSATSTHETNGTPSAARALLPELDSFATDLRRPHHHPLDRPPCAVTIISGTKSGRGRDAASRPRRGPPRPAASLPHGRWVEAPASGHMVMSASRSSWSRRSCGS